MTFGGVAGIALLLLLHHPVAVLAAAASLGSTTSTTTTTTPEPHSALLGLQSYYLRHPPHDYTLYDVLHVSPNATAADIVRSYRRLCRRHHPDKQQPRRGGGTKDDDPTSGLPQIREAYDILKNDAARLAYHRYGLWSTAQALRLLTGQSSQFNKHNKYENDDPLLRDLLQLIGQDPAGGSGRSTNDHDHRRLGLVTADLRETLRPYVEGRVTLPDWIHEWAAHCDALKTLPLGAQILRCTGRAYRDVGRRYLYRLQQERQQHQRQQRQSSTTVLSKPSRHRPSAATRRRAQHVQHLVRERWRGFKHVLHAAVVSGQVVLEERKEKERRQQQEQQQKNKLASIEYSGGDEDDASNFDDEEEEDSTAPPVVGDELPPSDEELRRLEHDKVQRANLQSLQLTALWKIQKIRLDRTVRQACRRILDEGDASFWLQEDDGDDDSFPDESHHPHHRSGIPPPPPRVDGWVGVPSSSSSSRRRRQGQNHHHQQPQQQRPVQAVSAIEARYRAAEALATLGACMVERSKEGTAWME